MGSAERIRGLAERVRERLGARPRRRGLGALGRHRPARRAARARPEPRRGSAGDRRRCCSSATARSCTRSSPAGAVRDRLLTHVGVVLGELQTIYTGVQYLGELTPRSLDAISASASACRARSWRRCSRPSASRRAPWTRAA